MPLQTFEDAFNKLKPGEKPSILLANGFSQAWDHNIFNYQNLFQKANFGSRNTLIKQIFNNFSTYDFEKIMRALEAAESVCVSYGFDQTKINDIKADQQILKDSLVDVISQTHPARSSGVTTKQYERAKSFIKRFNNTFTLNYDLLLYWIVNKNDIDPQGYFTDDGFRGKIWTNEISQDVYFLHGGLHIYDDGSSINKHTFRKDTDASIVEQVRSNLNQGKFPLFVSEPTHDKKLARIKHNPYLNYCFNALKKLRGPLFIHGHSMSENDRHIFKQIQESDISKVFISIYGDKESLENKETIANAMQFIQNENIRVEFYDASSTPIWF